MMERERKRENNKYLSLSYTLSLSLSLSLSLPSSSSLVLSSGLLLLSLSLFKFLFQLLEVAELRNSRFCLKSGLSHDSLTVDLTVLRSDLDGATGTEVIEELTSSLGGEVFLFVVDGGRERERERERGRGEERLRE